MHHKVIGKIISIGFIAGMSMLVGKGQNGSAPTPITGQMNNFTNTYHRPVATIPMNPTSPSK